MTIHNSGRRWVVTVLWRYLGRLAAVITGGILVTFIIIDGESWAIQQAPVLLTDSTTGPSREAACLLDDSADAGVLQLAILH